jgi:hypothetical protein
MDDALDICPHCKFDFTKQVIKGTGRRIAPVDDANEVISKDNAKKEEDDILPPHMLASEEESVLPPHMLEGAATKESDLVAETPQQPIPKSTSPVVYVLIGMVIVAAIVAPKYLKKPEPAKVVEAPQKPATPPLPSVEDPAKPAVAKPEKKASRTIDSGPPTIEDDATPRRRRPKKTRRARAPEPQAVIPPDPKPVAKGPKKFRVKGRILNLETMTPVSDATLVFTSPSGRKIRTATGASGNFRASMPSSSGYKLAISHKDYESKWIPEGDHKSMDEDERKEVAESLRKKSPKNAAIAPGGDGRLTQNYLLVPIPKHGMSMEEALAQ